DVGTEGPDRAVAVSIRLEALEDLLRVVEDRGRRVERERPVGPEDRVVPTALRRPAGGDHVVGEELAEAGVGEDLPPTLGGRRRGRELPAELKTCGHGCTVSNRQGGVPSVCAGRGRH